jgi:hypothetical protein
MAWNGISRSWPDWNGLDWRKSILACLERLGIEEAGFVQLKWLVMEEVCFGLLINSGQTLITICSIKKSTKNFHQFFFEC